MADCFYTVLAKYDATEILIGGSEIEGQTGSLCIDFTSQCFTQNGDMNRECVKLFGDLEFVSC